MMSHRCIKSKNHESAETWYPGMYELVINPQKLWPEERPIFSTRFHSDVVQFSCSVMSNLVTQLCPIICDRMDCSIGLPVHHQLLELAQTHVHWVGDAIQPSHPLLSPSLPAFSLSQWCYMSHLTILDPPQFYSTRNYEHILCSWQIERSIRQEKPPLRVHSLPDIMQRNIIERWCNILILCSPLFLEPEEVSSLRSVLISNLYLEQQPFIIWCLPTCPASSPYPHCALATL